MKQAERFESARKTGAYFCVFSYFADIFCVLSCFSTCCYTGGHPERMRCSVIDLSSITQR